MQGKLGNFISSFGRRRWWCDNRWLTSWLSFHSESTLGADDIRPPADIQSGFSGLYGFPLPYGGIFIFCWFFFLPVCSGLISGVPLLFCPNSSFSRVYSTLDVNAFLPSSFVRHLHQLEDQCDRLPSNRHAS